MVNAKPTRQQQRGFSWTRTGAKFSLGKKTFKAVPSLALVVAWLGVLLGQPLRGATVAVIPLSQEMITAADLLTVNLSAQSNVTVIEREQWQKIMREQSLALTQPESIVQAGRLLGAQGLILLERRAAQRTNEVLSVRLVAVTPGVVILEDQFPWPLTQLPEWAGLNSLRFQRALPKLNVKREEAVPVSIGSLRSSVSTGEGVALESELTALLRLRLAQEPSVFVLERRSMESLQSEKELGLVEEPFWNGAIIVDGLINRDLVSRTNVTVHARLAVPQRPATEVAVSGSRESLNVLIDRLVTQILAGLGKKEKLPVWQTEAEAEKFLQEAEWAAKWGLWTQVAEAADTAWALGKRTPVVGAHRITARAWLCLGMRGPADYDYVAPYKFRAPPHPNILPSLVRVTDIYRESFSQFTASANPTRIGWASLGIDLLLVSARILDRFQNHPEWCEFRTNELEAVRSACRDLNTLLLTNAGLGLSGWRRELQGLPTVYWHTKDGPVSSLAEAWFDAGGVWFETPDEAVGLYRKLPDSPAYRSVRDRFFGRGIPLAAWSVHDRLRTREVWCEFGREMTASTNLQVRLDGWRMILTFSERAPALELAAGQMFEEVLRHRVTIFDDGLRPQIDEVLSETLRRIAKWGVPETEQRIQSLRAEAQTRLSENDPEFSYLIWKGLLKALAETNRSSMTFRRPKVPPAPEQIAEIMAGLETIARGSRNPAFVRGFIENLQAYVPAAQKLAPPTATAALPAPPSGTGAIVFSQVWHLDQLRWPSDRISYREPMRKATWQEGDLWLEVQTYGTSHDGANPKLAGIRLSPGTMRSEMILAPFESFSSSFDYQRHILVVSNELYVIGAGSLWRRAMNGTWTSFRLPTDVGGVPYRWGKLIAVSVNGAILAFDPGTGDVQILASTRRSPAASALDGRTWGLASLAVWPDNTLCAVVNGQVWRFDDRAKDWLVFASATNCGQTIEAQPQGILLRQTSKSLVSTGPGSVRPLDCGPQLLGGWRPNRTVPDYFTWTPPAFPARILSDYFTPPRWNHPAGSFPHDSQAQFEGANLWVFPAPFGLGAFESELPSIDQYGRPGRAGTNYIPSTILFLDAARNETVELPVRFTGAAREFAEAYERNRVQSRGHVEFILTEAGLAVVVTREGVIFWLPRNELNASLLAARTRALGGNRSPIRGASRFDRDANGWLDDAEDRAMRRDAAWQKERAQQSDTETKAAIRQHAAEWERLFAQSDKNRDGRLSGVELDRAAQAQPDIFARRVLGLNGSATRALRPFNLDNDLGLDAAEFLQFMAELRSLAEINLATDWVTRFGVKPEQCDTNDDGVLDAGERAQLPRLLRAKGATK